MITVRVVEEYDSIPHFIRGCTPTTYHSIQRSRMQYLRLGCGYQDHPLAIVGRSTYTGGNPLHLYVHQLDIIIVDGRTETQPT